MHSEIKYDEERTKQLISEYLKSIGQSNVEKNADELVNLNSGIAGRFDFFVPQITDSAKNSLLISGCAIGSEHIIAERYGFRNIYGVEISNVFVSIANDRLSVNKNMFVDYYDGERLPYDDNFFTTVVSAHIIEHAKSPDGYLSEIFRVLSPGGFLFIEFPNRYHTRELHTGAFSFEWLPSFLRSFILKYLGSSLSPLSSEKMKIYKIIYETLKPISTWQIKNFLQRFDGGKSRIISKQIPAPGFVRLLIKKYQK